MGIVKKVKQKVHEWYSLVSSMMFNINPELVDFIL